jgi:hypothetical protein
MVGRQTLQNILQVSVLEGMACNMALVNAPGLFFFPSCYLERKPFELSELLI